MNGELLRYAGRRLLISVPTVLGVLLLTFVLFRLLPTDIAEELAGPGASHDTVATIRWAHGLDKPLWLNWEAARKGAWWELFDSQLVNHLRRMVLFRFGRSWYTRESISAMLRRGVGPSLSLTVPIFAGSVAAALFLAILAVHQRGTRWDTVIVVLCVVGMNVPLLTVILVGQFVLGYQLGWFPVYGYASPWHLVLPVLIGIVAGLGGQVRFYRTVLLEEMNHDYVRTAYAKGAGEARVLVSHVLRHALAPMLTRLVMAIPFLVTGSLLLERFFGIPGVGYVLVEAIGHRDYPVVNAMTFLLSLAFIGGNLLTDISYRIVDPRVVLS